MFYRFHPFQLGTTISTESGQTAFSDSQTARSRAVLRYRFRHTPGRCSQYRYSDPNLAEERSRRGEMNIFNFKIRQVKPLTKRKNKQISRFSIIEDGFPGIRANLRFACDTACVTKPLMKSEKSERSDVFIVKALLPREAWTPTRGASSLFAK